MLNDDVDDYITRAGVTNFNVFLLNILCIIIIYYFLELFFYKLELFHIVHQLFLHIFWRS